MSCSNIGGRKNICDHLFVLNAVLNDITKNTKDFDIQIMDIETCFDKMWYSETVTLATKLHAIRQALLILTVVLIGNLRMKAECFQVKIERFMQTLEQ